MRVTRHNSRGYKHSKTGFSPKHNDRNFDLQQAKNIDPKRTAANVYWNCYDGKVYSEKERSEKMTFEEVEKRYYEEHFTGQWKVQQAKYQARRQYGYMKSFDDWRQSKRYCPEQSVLQAGNIDGHADRKTMGKIGMDFVKELKAYAKAHNNCYQVLDYAFHCDESVPHFQIGMVWQHRDSEGNLCIGQNEALKQAGVELPEPDKPEGQFNNRKMTFDKFMRDKLLEICEKHGLQVEWEPEPNVKHNRTKQKMIADKQREIQEKLDKLPNELILQMAEEIKQRQAEEAAKQAQRVQRADEELQDVVKPRKHGGKVAKPSDFSLGE